MARNQLSSNIVSPSDFEEFLPWAAGRYDVLDPVYVTRKQQDIYVSGTKSKRSDGKSVEVYKDKGFDSSSSGRMEEEDFINIINIITIYHDRELVQIEMKNIKCLPKEILKIIALIVEFHPSLQKISINNTGLDQYGVYELSKILPLTNITEICLDDIFVKEANYALLLDQPNSLKVLSLARCKLGDQVVKDIAEKITYPRPASKTLCVLNLSTNMLTDKSAKYLATVLRCNRKLCFLNLAGNMITDEGGVNILKVLMQFPLTLDENLAFRQRQIAAMKIDQTYIAEHLKKSGIKKEVALKKDKNVVKKKDGNLSKLGLLKQIDTDDPMYDSSLINGWRYSSGNETLAYLNVAYNTLSDIFLKLLVNVVTYQYRGKRTKKGLVNIQIDGNPMSSTCQELSDLDGLISSRLINVTLANRLSSRKSTRLLNLPVRQGKN